MPLPTPKDGESKNDFIGRCVSTLHNKDEFDSNDQRVAVCYSQWEKANEEFKVSDYLHYELEEATFKRVNRVRGGKVQRRKKVADKPGYKIKDGKVVRMKASERLKRKRGAKKASRKRKAKKSQIKRATKKSMRRRKARGL